MELVIASIGGILVGIIGTVLLLHFRSNGCLRVDRSIPEDGPRLFLELSESVDVISKKKYITIAINNKSYLSR